MIFTNVSYLLTSIASDNKLKLAIHVIFTRSPNHFPFLFKDLIEWRLVELLNVINFSYKSNFTTKSSKQKCYFLHKRGFIKFMKKKYQNGEDAWVKLQTA